MSPNNQSHLDAKRNIRPLDMAVYFITFGLGVTTLAAASSALVKRNNEVGAASDAAATQGSKSPLLPLLLVFVLGAVVEHEVAIRLI